MRRWRFWFFFLTFLPCVFGATNQDSVYEISFSQTLNSHYRSRIGKELGVNRDFYVVTGQEESPEEGTLIGLPVNPNFILTKVGKISLILFCSKTNHFLLIDARRAVWGKQEVLGGSNYRIKYSFRNIAKDVKGDLYIVPIDKGLPEVDKIPLEDILKGLYETAYPLTPLPFKIGIFSKRSNPAEQWVMIMKDVAEERYADFLRVHVGSEDIPEQLSSPPQKVYPVDFENRRFELAWTYKNNEKYLFIRVAAP
ncbi:MAG: hypothetical protein HY401_08690 [Elusimicrobia bacterium]|nr:hypothetical protein [Elusimicrobiota bacterium]